MARQLTIDGSGRVLIPKDVRTTHGLVPGSRLMLVEDEGRLVLVLESAQPRLVERNGLLVVAATQQAEILDHRSLRPERLADLGSLPGESGA